MAITSSIEWTDATWNPWQGCTKVSEACDHCYMFRDMRRWGRDPSVVRKSADATWSLPIKRVKGKYVIPDGWKVFTCSWSDWFHKAADAWRPQAWDIIRQRPRVIFQIVTKRTERIRDCLPPDWGDGWPNVWLIATVENQHWADVRVPQLLEVPAAVRGLSIEPLLGPLELWKSFPCAYYCDESIGHVSHPFLPDANGCNSGGIDWIIAGGESGAHARPSHPDWIRSLRDQCQAAGVAFFFKQWGEWYPCKHRCSAGHEFEDGQRMWRLGKKQSGRLLDGREHSEFPLSREKESVL